MTINTNNVIVDDMHINTYDAPDFCDCYITAAYWKDSKQELTDEELDYLNQDTDFVYNQTLNRIY